jgi:hypothetical protein
LQRRKTYRPLASSINPIFYRLGIKKKYEHVFMKWTTGQAFFAAGETAVVPWLSVIPVVYLSHDENR